MRRVAAAGMVMVMLLALAILLYPNRSGPSITGFQVAETQPRDYRGLSSVYSVVPITRISINYSFSEYEQIAAEAKELVSQCAGSQDLAACINSHLKTGWIVAGTDGNYYMFSVKGAYKLPQYDETAQKVEYKEIEYRFALDFS